MEPWWRRGRKLKGNAVTDIRLTTSPKQVRVCINENGCYAQTTSIYMPDGVYTWATSQEEHYRAVTVSGKTVTEYFRDVVWPSIVAESNRLCSFYLYQRSICRIKRL